MSSLDSFLFLGVTVAFLWCLWLMFGFVFDVIEQYHAAWRDERRREAQRFADFYVRNYSQAAPKQDGEASEAAKGTGAS